MDTQHLNLDNMTDEQAHDVYEMTFLNVEAMAKKYGLSVEDMKKYKAYAINKAMAKQFANENMPDEAAECEKYAAEVYETIEVKW